MKKMTYEEWCEAKDKARLRREDNFLAREERREAAAAKHIGELQKADGSIHYYISHPGCRRHFESDSHTECVAYLVRNGYIR